MSDIPALPQDGERLLTEFQGKIVHEHLHRYSVARQYITGKDVLDIACGEGYGSNLLSEGSKSVTGVDIAQNAITHARAKYQHKHLKFVVGSCTSIPLPNSSIDVAVSFETLEHFTEHEMFISELKRILRPDGLLIISSPDKRNYSDVPNYQNPFHLRELHHDEFKKLIRDNFKETTFAKQEYNPGSIIELECATPISHIDGNYTKAKYKPLQDIATYSIAFASDTSLPKIQSSIFKCLTDGNEQDLFNTQLFISSTPEFTEEHALTVSSHAEQRIQIAFENINNHVSAGPIYLRLDPADLVGVIEIHEIKIIINGVNGETRSTLLPQPKQFYNLHPILIKTPQYFSTTNDPQIILPPIDWDGIGTVSLKIDLKLSSDLTKIVTYLSQMKVEIAQRDSSINELNHSLKQRDSSINELNHSLEQRDSSINELNHSLEQRDNTIEALKSDLDERTNKVLRMENSFIWKSTAPIREIQKLFGQNSDDMPSLKYWIDSPKKTFFQMHRGVLHVTGWCFDEATGEPADRIFIKIGNREIECAKVERNDVSKAYSIDNTNVGFEAFFKTGHGLKLIRVIVEHQGKITLIGKYLFHYNKTKAEENGNTSDAHFRDTIPLDDYQTWCLKNNWTPNQLAEIESKLKGKRFPKISIIMPVYNPPMEFFKIALQTIEAQVYPNWELCIADDCSTNADVRVFLQDYAKENNKTRITFRPKNGHISAATNSAADLATGDFLVFMDQDDELTPDALAEIALYLDKNPDSDVIYSDDDKIDTMGNRFAPQFKPDWSPELLLSYMYMGHIFSVRKELYWKVGGTRLGYEGSQDYDLALRATEKARHVGHIPRILYHWRVLEGSTASSGNEKNYSFEAGIKAVQDALDRRSIPAKAYQPKWAIESGCGYYSHKFEDQGDSVAIIIPMKNQAKITSRLLRSLERTTYTNFKVYIINNESNKHITNQN